MSLLSRNIRVYKSSPLNDWYDAWVGECPLQIKASIAKESAYNPDALKYVKKQLRSSIIRQVFGEFESYINNIYYALNTEDLNRAWEEVELLRRAMFDDEGGQNDER